jgi:photosystem II stability/assembly factor-like uncharacterized protein
LSIKRQSSTSRAAALALAVLVLAACKRPDPVPESSAPAIEFSTASSDLDEFVWTEQADEFGVDVCANGLRAIDKDTAFLFGDLRIPASSLRSFLLRTSDGGKSWHEVMPYVPGSELIHVAFSDSQHGWALAQWAVEGPGAIVLFGTADGGNTWRQLTDVGRSQGRPPPGNADYPLRMTFTSALKGEIELALANDGESSSIDDSEEEIETLATDDGGVNWRVVRRETRKSSTVETEAAQHDRGFDDTEWELGTRACGEPITIRRFDREQRHWHVTTLPTHFQYRRGRVLTPP